MPIPPIALALGAGALLLMSRKSESAKTSYATAPSDGSAPPTREPAVPEKGWAEMPPQLQEQVAAALGALGVSPATGQVTGAPSADSLRMATQTAGLCESQGFYQVAAELRRLAGEAAKKVATPPAAKKLQAVAPPGLSPAEAEAITRTLTLDRDPKSIQALIVKLERMPKSPQRDSFIGMAQALLLQLQAAQSTTATMQQIDQVIKAPTAAAVATAVKPLPPAVIPVAKPAAKPIVLAPKAEPIAVMPKAQPGSGLKFKNTTPTLGRLKLDDYPDPNPSNPIIKLGSRSKYVATFQTILNSLGYNVGTADGIFGKNTDAQTRAFQSWGLSRTGDERIKPDGIVGPITRQIVRMALVDRERSTLTRQNAFS